MNRLIEGARFNPEKTDKIRRRIIELFNHSDFSWELIADSFRKSDPSGEKSYFLTCQIREYQPNSKYQ